MNPLFKSGLKYKFITENERKFKYSLKIINNEQLVKK